MLGRVPFVGRRRWHNELLRTAFAGDGIEKALVQTAVRALDIRSLVETGTRLGKTSLWLGTTFPQCRVYTCEIEPEVHEAAAKTLSRQKNVRADLADSEPWIEALCAHELRAHNALFFLDAHGMDLDWDHELPLTAELRSIERRDVATVVIIDDFKVPGRPDLAFCVQETLTSVDFPEQDRMSLDHALDIDAISGVLDDGDVLLYPDYSREDALRFQSDPLHPHLVGYVVILHACRPAQLGSLLDDPLVRQYFRRAG